MAQALAMVAEAQDRYAYLEQENKMITRHKTDYQDQIKKLSFELAAKRGTIVQLKNRINYINLISVDKNKLDEV